MSKVSKYGVCSGLYFIVFGLNLRVSLPIPSEYGKISDEEKLRKLESNNMHREIIV